MKRRGKKEGVCEGEVVMVQHGSLFMFCLSLSSGAN